MLRAVRLATRRSLSTLAACCLGVVAPSFLAASRAGAQDVAAAEALFKKGLEDMQAGRYDPGCNELAESQPVGALIHSTC